MNIAVVVLAAGMGKRMKSDVPKVLHPVLGRPILSYVLDTVDSLLPKRVVVVVGHGAEDVKKISGSKKVAYVTQSKQLGTGHAANCATQALKNFKGNILILNGDFPLITTASLKKFVNNHEKKKADISILTALVDDPSGYGRIKRDQKGKVSGIVEEKDATREERYINEINSGTYCVKSSFLWSGLNKVNTKNKQKEYYLTDIVGIANRDGLNINGVVVSDSDEVMGVNDRLDLSYVESALKWKTNEKLMRSGVTLVDPENTYIAPQVKVGRDTTIYPNTHIYGNSQIGRNCIIGPSSWIEDSKFGNSVTVRASCYVTNASVRNNITIGPFAHLRPDAEIMDGAKIGNFVEIKKSKIGRGSKVPHLSYVGDATLGKDVNIGAGTITCNYDGVDKHRTVIEDNVFIGSDTMLVAPIKVGKGSTTGAGSTISKDVPSGSLAIGRARQTNINDWKRKTKEKGRKKAK
ncbi:MAG: bifunctional protein GlmU [Thermodesulfobacteriota bacterium]|nr:MAG: bifunctional protein GlmU [Thermodesulfobacteriota bacterium]